jgi:hypothetical protein
VYFITLLLFKLFCRRLFLFSLRLFSFTQQQISAVVAHPPALKIGCVVCVRARVCACVSEEGEGEKEGKG